MDRVSRLFQATGISHFIQWTFILSPQCILTPFVPGPLVQEEEKRLLAFTKRGTSTHSVSYPSSLISL